MNSPDPKKAISKPGQIHLLIIDVMKRFPDGVSGGQIRHELEKDGLKPEDQTHLDRRKRDLKKWFVIRKKSSSVLVDGKKRNVVLYQFGGERKSVTDEGQIGIKVSSGIGTATDGFRSMTCAKCSHGASFNRSSSVHSRPSGQGLSRSKM